MPRDPTLKAANALPPLSHLRCMQCGKRQKLLPDDGPIFVKMGWPQCHDQTMRLFTANDAHADPFLTIVGYGDGEKASKATEADVAMVIDALADAGQFWKADVVRRLWHQAQGAQGAQIVERLRKALVYEAQVVEAHLTYKSFPKSRREVGERQVQRMTELGMHLRADPDFQARYEREKLPESN